VIPYYAKLCLAQAIKMQPAESMLVGSVKLNFMINMERKSTVSTAV